VSNDTAVGDLDIYQIMHAAGQVESLLKLTIEGSFSGGV
jgi:hypothetical protein